MSTRTIAIALLLTLIALLTIGSALAGEEEQEWGVPIVAVDWSSLQRTPATADLWVTKSFGETITLGHDVYPHRSQKLMYAIDCADGTYALKEWILTEGANGTGNTVWADRAEHLDYVSAPKGTVEAAVIVAACQVNPKSTVARNPGKANPVQ
jgi:hypothetical protein